MNKKKLITGIVALVFLSIAFLMVFSSKGKIVSASFNMKEVAPKVYVDPDMSQDNVKMNLKDLKSSQDISGATYDTYQEVIFYLEGMNQLIIKINENSDFSSIYNGYSN